MKTIIIAAAIALTSTVAMARAHPEGDWGEKRAQAKTERLQEARGGGCGSKGGPGWRKSNGQCASWKD